MKLTSTPSAARALALAALLAVPGLAAAQNAPATQALSALKSRQASLGLAADDLADAAVTSQYTDRHNGITHVYLRQRVQGIEVYGAVADVHFGQSGKVASLHSSFRSNVKAQARPAAPGLSPEQAVAAAARALNMPAPRALQLEKAGSGAEGMEFNNGGISLENIPVKLMYLPMPDGALRLVWDVTLAPTNAEHYWNARVDASTGALLDKTDYTISDSFSLLNLTRPLTGASAAAATPAPAPGPANRPAAPNSYNVWPLTVESPSHGAREVVVNPADAFASPFGWHDTDGKAGAEYTITRGNNVHAYDDRNGANAYTAGTNVSPDGGASLEFNFPFDATMAAPALSNLDAAVVNLFYWNNLTHDIMVRKGFDEVSGNFQTTNYTGQGRGGDYVQAEAQDGAGLAVPTLNNANFSTPPDGTRPRMQMFLWDQLEPASITAPANLAGPLLTGTASFGRSIAQVGPITGNLVLVNDGTADPTHGCGTAYTNAAAVNGNIALIDRGSCNFALKAQMAQAAGAKMAVIVDNVVASNPIGLGGTADTAGLRIPTISILKTDGDRIKAALAAGQTVTISVTGKILYRDSDFDNGIIAHEYGHGISTRLTGGPATSCLNSQEQMGEGWSDFFALWMTTKPGDVGTTGRGIGTYASFENTDGGGIRPTRYSTDLRINPTTYAVLGTGNYVVGSTGTVPVHAIGYAWCTALWDMNWALIEAEGYNPDLRASTGGNNVALQLVMDGLKLQPCSPGFIDGRNAILKADSINYKGAHAALIWRVFARRGMGFSASQGSSNSLTDQTAAFDVPAVLSSSKQLSEKMMEVYPNPATNQITVRTQVSSSAPVQVELVSLLGQRVSVQTIAAARLQQEGVVVNTSALAGGVYVVRLTTSEGTITKKVVVQH
ncbi:T9SS-dependent M36 family metallopeptidase [Hymenobacter sp. NST-14]|uniref:T9SS-dependent M36 family metallopeptidase n=1 Tax=Hymenobacter piscis TaxID=2839984 RepID=UPI001C023DF8|nr:T9SS-dependent M36 family metallopeptidase [Hymenobacter piscis]MBT9393278.1 T9SS-dependent M36 family metallopeptidase [Hymenobacter piscis]